MFEVNGPTFTVNFYQNGSTTPIKTLSFTKAGGSTSPTVQPTVQPTQPQISPTWFCAGGVNCVLTSTPTPAVTVPTQPTGASPIEASPTAPVVASPTTDPCATQRVRESRDRDEDHKKPNHKKQKNGGVGNLMKFFLQLIEQLLNMLIKLLGGGTINITPPDNTSPTLEPTNGAEPTQPDTVPTAAPEPTINPCLTPAQETPTQEVQPTQPQDPTPTVFNEPTVPPTSEPSPTSSQSVSGEAIPGDNLVGWKLIFAEDFTLDAPMGSWGSTCTGTTSLAASEKIVYTGANGTKWRTYPDCYLDTYQRRPYRSDQVLSVHDGVLDFFLHPVNGQPAGANPSPLITGTSQYQTYGRYVARFKVDPGLSEYYAAWLLWPQTESEWECAESDFPEGQLDGVIKAFHHYGCTGSQDTHNTNVNFTSGWHTYAQEWTPGVRKYYLDGQLIKTSTISVYSKPARWQLQTETKGSGSNSGHLLLDWVAVYSYQP